MELEKHWESLDNLLHHTRNICVRGNADPQLYETPSPKQQLYVTLTIRSWQHSKHLLPKCGNEPVNTYFGKLTMSSPSHLGTHQQTVPDNLRARRNTFLSPFTSRVPRQLCVNHANGKLPVGSNSMEKRTGPTKFHKRSEPQEQRSTRCKEQEWGHFSLGLCTFQDR